MSYHFICKKKGCRKEHQLPARAIAQLSMRVPMTFTCDCGTKRTLTPAWFRLVADRADGRRNGGHPPKKPKLAGGPAYESVAMSWKDVDEWAAKQPRTNSTGRALIKKPKRTDYVARANERIARGFHPLGHTHLAKNDETCGTCAHFVEHQPGANKYFKCRKYGITRGPGTDIRKSWPACTLWEEEKP